MSRALLLSLLALLAACDNPCQQMCVEMAKYAEECDFTVDPAEVQACRDDYATSALTNEQAQECIIAGDPQQLREWWSCEDLLENYENAGG